MHTIIIKSFISYVLLCTYASCIDAYRNWIARNLPVHVYSATIRNVTCILYNYTCTSLSTMYMYSLLYVITSNNNKKTVETQKIVFTDILVIL